MPGKPESRLDTLCRSQSRLPSGEKHLFPLMFMPDKTAFGYKAIEKSGLRAPKPAFRPVTGIRTESMRSFAARTIDFASRQLRGELQMAKYALYAELKAKPGKEAEVEAFLKQGGAMAQSETGTVEWYGFKEDKPGVFGIFDTFDDEAGREGHLNGEIAKA